ncbi:MAG TPA: DUF2889 domain-containing protein [Thermodesulfobacteriota bacterium]|jgi:hypothetical protein|nr:DUF2889 domain-containing protein [Thermodesulfobacteriota bacterium]
MKKLVHNREISIKTSDLGNHTILVEGSLIDHRYRPMQNETSEVSELVHHMAVRLKVRGPGMLIEQAEATMPYHPREECPEMLPSIRNLEGLSITPGYSIKVKKAIGGTKGCAHLTSLIIAMGESAVQGYWAAYEAERVKKGLREQTIKKFINTCHLWREDGPIVRGLREALESQDQLE